MIVGIFNAAIVALIWVLCGLAGLLICYAHYGKHFKRDSFIYSHAILYGSHFLWNTIAVFWFNQ